MKKIKNTQLWFFIIPAIFMTAMLVSCHKVPVATSPNQPVKPSESSPSTTISGAPPEINTYQDLSVYIDTDPSQIDNSKFPITPVEALGVIGEAPDVNIGEYTLAVDGLVNSPLSLSYEALLKYPTVSEVVLLICPGGFVDNAEWTGIPLTTLLAEAGIKSDASQVTFHALDGYKLTFSLPEVQRDGVFLAYMVNGQILPKEHGYPVRLVMKGKYGFNWVRWLNRIEVE